MSNSPRPSTKSLRLGFDALERKRSVNDVAAALGVHKEFARRVVSTLVADGLVHAVSQRTTSRKTGLRLFQQVPGAVWGEPPKPSEGVLPDPYMFRMVAVRPGGVHA